MAGMMSRTLGCFGGDSLPPRGGRRIYSQGGILQQVGRRSDGVQFSWAPYWGPASCSLMNTARINFSFLRKSELISPWIASLYSSFPLQEQGLLGVSEKSVLPEGSGETSSKYLHGDKEATRLTST